MSLRFSDARLSVAAAEPRTPESVGKLLDALLEPVLSSRRSTAHLAAALHALPRDRQDFVLHWIPVIAGTSAELAFQFAAGAPAALRTLEPAAAEAWIIEAMDAYDRDGLHSGSEVFRHPRSFRADSAPSTVAFAEVANVLQLFARGLSGRPLRIETAAQPYTDTETLFVPARIARHPTRADNFLLYKATLALLWAQVRYGTFSADLESVCAAYPDPARALQLLYALETIRLEARLASDLPGLARDMSAFRTTAPDARCARLTETVSSVHDSIALLGELYEAPPPFEDFYGAVLEPGRAALARAERIARQKKALQTALAKILEEQAGDEVSGLTVEKVSERDANGPSGYVLALDGEAISAPPALAELIDSILDDLGEIPGDYLMPAAAAAADAAEEREDAERAQTAFHYDEWDFARRHYRKQWCTLRESEVGPGDAEFVARTCAKYSSRIAQLKRTFELMRGEERVLRRQADGDGVDLDALIEAYADMRAGSELGSLVFTRRRKNERDLAVMFMVDMSGSTKGWINEAEREALVMLCEALEVLGDRYAIYGFSGITRKRCEIYRIKRFDEPYGPPVHERIAGIEPQDYTRMGAAIRHLTMLLGKVEARTKLLITLSDGKPEDYSDNYRGEYGIEDTRQALLEAHRSGVKPFCITIDREAREYLPHLYGAVNWTVVDDVASLPLKVAGIYQRLTM